MRHPLRWFLVAITVVVVAVVGVGAWYVFGDSAPAKPKLDTSKPIDTSGPATPAGNWKVQQGNQVYAGYRMTEVFAGDVIHKEAVGRSPAVSGTMTIVPGQVTAVAVTAQMQQLTSDRLPRDNYIHTHAIESDRYPTATFVLTKPITLPVPTVKGQTLHLSATGNLTLHGVTRTISAPLEARWTGAEIDVVSEKSIPIVLADYKIDPPDTGVVKVDNHGYLELSLTFVPA